MISVLLINFIITSTSAQLLVELPDAPTNNLTIYAGYFPFSDEEKIHYTFVHAETNSNESPVIVWMANKVGCSNYWPLFSSIGPFQITKNSQVLAENPNSWTKHANLLVIDIPGGIGYSLVSPSRLYTDDDLINIYVKVLQQFQLKFPAFKANDIYLSGSDDSSWIIPLFIEHIKNNSLLPSLNLKGVFGLNFRFADDLVFKMANMYYYGLVSEKNYRSVKYNCCGGFLYNCSDITKKCNRFIKKCIKEILEIGINPYNLHMPCAVNDENNERQCYDVSEFTSYFNREDVRNAFYVLPEVNSWEKCAKVKNFEKKDHDFNRMIRKTIDNDIKLFLINGDLSINNFVIPQRIVHDLGYPQLSAKKAFSINDVVSGFITEYKGVDFATILGGGYLCSNKADVVLHLLHSFLNN